MAVVVVIVTAAMTCTVFGRLGIAEAARQVTAPRDTCCGLRWVQQAAAAVPVSLGGGGGRGRDGVEGVGCVGSYGMGGRGSKATGLLDVRRDLQSCRGVGGGVAAEGLVISAAVGVCDVGNICVGSKP